MTPATSADTDSRRLAAEVLELGETLFDAVLEAAAHPAPAADNDPFPEAELRTAADAFFRTLRVLLGVGEGSLPDGSPPREDHVSSSGISTDSTRIE